MAKKRKNLVKKKRKKTNKFNAVKVAVDGVEFKSKLEAYMYTQLVEAGFVYNETFFYERTKLEVFPKFTDNDGKNVLAIHYTPDFIVEVGDKTIIIETKGRPNDSWPLRLKLIKKHLSVHHPDWKMYIPHNQQECRDVINDMLLNYGIIAILND